MNQNHCKHCEHKWYPRKPERALRCPECGRPNWDVAPKPKNGGK